MSKVKEKFGLVTLKAAPVASTPAASHPVYAPFVDLGAAVKAYVTAQRAEGQIYGDDVMQLNASEFTSADIQTETLLSDLEVESQLMGSQYSDGVLTDTQDDTVNPCALAWIQKLRTKTAVVFRAVFLFYATPILPDDQSDTKTNAITFTNNAINFTAYADNSGAWRARKDFSTQADAEAWLESQRAGATSGYAIQLITSGAVSATPDAGTYYVAGGSSWAVKFAAVPAALFDNGADVTAQISDETYTLLNIDASHNLVAIA